MSDRWRFTRALDTGKEPGTGLVQTWINTDDDLGSMRIAHDCTCSEDEAVRRTRLAAAAPGLLAALEKAMEPYRQFKNDDTNPPWVREARAVLAKARGA